MTTTRELLESLVDNMKKDRFEMQAGKAYAATRRWSLGYASIDTLEHLLTIAED